jgi:hypothetical protein
MIKRLALSLFFLFAGFWLSLNLENFPKFFYDEGFYAQIAKNVAIDARYATRFYRNWVPVEFAVGPSFLLPVSSAYKFFGFGIWQTRMWSVIATLGLLSALITIISRFGNPMIGIPLGFLILFQHFGHFRSAYGEPSAYCYFFWGLYFLLDALTSGHSKRFAIAGFFLGLALAAKATVCIFLVGGMSGWLLDRLKYKSWSLKNTVVFISATITPLLLWLGLGANSVGLHSFLQYNIRWAMSASNVSALGAATPVVLDDSGMAIFLFAQFIIVGVLWLLGRKNRELVPGQQTWLAAVGGLWLVSGFWFAFLSIGWYRYSMAFNLLTWLLVGVLLPGAYQFLRSNSLLASGCCQVIFLLATIRLLYMILYQFVLVMNTPELNRDVVAMGDYIRHSLPHQEEIETYEWTIDIFVPNILRHPSLDEIVERLTELKSGKAPSPIQFWKRGVPYLLTGPFSKKIMDGVYPDILLRQCAEAIHDEGEYHLYRIGPERCYLEHLQQLGSHESAALEGLSSTSKKNAQKGMVAMMGEKRNSAS